MSLPNTPFWTMAHLGLKFPGAAVVAGAVFLFLAEDTTPMVAITFDDGRESVINTALPMLQEREWPATAYVSLGLIDTPGFVTTEELQLLVANGWEIGAHGITHTDFTTLDDEKLLLELITPVQELASLTSQEILSVASPYGEYNDRTLEAISKVYFNHVNAFNPFSGVNTVDAFDPININRLDVTEDVTSEQVCKIVSSLPEDSLFVLLFHGVTEEPGRWNVTPDTFNSILDCLEDVNVVRLSDGAQAMELKQ